MVLTKIENNNIYIAYNDLTKDLLKKIDKLKIDNKTILSIKEFIVNHSLENNLKRQKNYISNLTTYIDSDEKYNLFIYIIPKEIEIKNPNFKQIEKLCIEIFKLYSKYVESKDIKFKALKEYKGDSFLELEFEFYLKNLNKLYSYLLNYKKSLKNKIVCSDKQIGISIDSLNIIENNPLKNYQFVKVSHQKDLIIFIYSLVEFLKKDRLKIFKYYKKYKDLKNIVNKIYNFLLKISNENIIKKEHLNKDKLHSFFIKYKNSKEIQKNKQIYIILENIFFNQLHNGVFFFKSIDLTKLFEVIIEKRLQHYGDKLYIGDEVKNEIIGIDNLNNKNYLLDNKIKQYPDFMIKENDIFHIIDAKYKLYNSLWKNRDIFWQLLSYAKLFNKTKNQKDIQKIIIYINKIFIDLSKNFNLNINTQNIDIYQNCENIKENLFDSYISLIGIDIFNL